LLMEGVITEQAREERSVVRGPLGFFTSHGSFATLGGQHRENTQVEAFDGQWTRKVYRSTQDDQAPHISASLRKGGFEKTEGRHEGVPVYRPHTLMQRDDWIYGPLADLLVSPWHDKINKYPLRFRYCGEAEVEGRRCVILRGDVPIGQTDKPHNAVVLSLN